ncbi:MAG: tetratricopeptide repeat protein [Methylococcaceae bacterium]|nr:tetratricopeptide repeat protein [Methylococcaceae bacterium]MDP3019723.1 tetratricopeptide repeat protein [Methylococcaceae bacterium]
MTALAQESWDRAIKKINYRESANVPPFCGSSKTNPKYNGIDWKKKFGEDFTYINHYCSHKAQIPVCYQYPEKEKNACLTAALEGTTYFFKSTSGNSPLLPFLYTEHGTILKEIGRYGEAIQAFNTAIQKNKSYIRAYAMLADTYILTKNYNEAEEIINEGLKYKKSKALYKKLDKIKTLKK